MPPFVIIGFRKCKAKGTSLKTALFRSLERGIPPTHIRYVKLFSSSVRLLPENYNSILPSIALSRVASSANSRFEPTGIP